MVLIMRNEQGVLSLNPGQSYLHFTKPQHRLGKVMHSPIPPPAMGKL